MCSFDDRYVVIFNGEIYNFALVRKEIQRVNPWDLFRTHSDTEVILNAFITWGPEMVKKLDAQAESYQPEHSFTGSYQY